jgi:hypothetical protein
MTPSSDILQLNADAIDLLHRNSMHPCYTYRKVMINPDTKDPTPDNTQPLPSEETGWERNYLGDDKSDPDIRLHSWRKMIDSEVMNAMKALNDRNMHRDKALTLLRQHCRVGGGIVPMILPLRKGAVLLHVVESGDALKPNLYYQIQLKSGQYTERVQWMPFVELALSEEDFDFQFHTPAEDYLRLNLQAMLERLFPEQLFDIMVDAVNTASARYVTVGMPYGRPDPVEARAVSDISSMQLWVRYDQKNLLVMPLPCPIHRRYQSQAIAATLWQTLAEKKLAIYDELDNLIERGIVHKP